MNDKLSKDFLLTIVWVESFSHSYDTLEINVICVENNKDVLYTLSFIEVVAFIYRNDFANKEFNVIDTILEKFNDCEYLYFMKDEKRNNLWALRFHSGTHHIIVGFKNVIVRRS
ncbi:hypothetical protein [Pedobacter sp. ASV12]|uniref:hypothetical protein n=1 Tax=Pedobacter sp. ASV12 TaxID=2795120 RepID=UPI0018EC499F|nr:hypothetical protein [Pedobacter sp. ASV12]